MPKPSRRALLTGLLGAGTAFGVGALGRPTGAEAARTTNPSAAAARSGRTREYWLQVESMPHRVVPSGHNEMTGRPFTGRDSITAVVYRAYSPGWQHPLPASADLGPNTGFPGPVLRAEVGDEVIVHVRNHDTHYRQPHSLHVHGLRYRSDSDGAWVATAPSPDGAIPFGASYTYHYQALPSSAGTWPYHDHSVDFRIPGSGGPSMSSSMPGMDDSGDGVMELGAELGLVGHVIVTEPHEKRPDREFYLVMHDFYADDLGDIDGDLDCFNGRAFLGNTPTFTARVGEHVRWHVVALGTEFHVFHLHGHRWRSAAGPYVDAVLLGPATSTVVDYVEDNPGRWLYHCHVVDHMMGGMVGWYTVTG
jgi:FtsP/CotA-like multicopper oxidase with cupredoxin domain